MSEAYAVTAATLQQSAAYAVIVAGELGCISHSCRSPDRGAVGLRHRTLPDWLMIAWVRKSLQSC